MRVLLTPLAAEDWHYWQQHDGPVLERIRRLLNRLKEDETALRSLATPIALPYPQLLSVKISAEHRMVLERLGGKLIIHQLRYHY